MGNACCAPEDHSLGLEPIINDKGKPISRMSVAFFDITVRRITEEAEVPIRSLTEGANAIVVVNVAS